MAKMLKSMSPEHAEKLVGKKQWSELLSLWQSVEGDEGSTTLFENLARRWERKFQSLSKEKTPGQKYTFDPAKAADENIGTKSLHRFSTPIDLDMSALLQAEGVDRERMYVYSHAEKSGTFSYDTTQLVEMSLWGMIGMSSSTDPALTLDRLLSNMAPHLKRMRQDTGKAVSRINEMRKTPNFIEYMREWFPSFYLDGVAGLSNLAEHEDCQLILDITGLSKTGDLEPDHWCNVDMSRFRKASELLILDVADNYKGNQQPPAQSKIMYTEQMAGALTTLPAQLLLLQGVDPERVMRGVRSRVEYLFSQTVDYPGKEGVRDSLCKLPFFLYPEYWDDFGISTGDFLGLDVRREDPKAEVSSSHMAVTYYGLGAHRHSDKIIAFSEAAGIDLADPENIFRLGFGNHLPYSLAAVSEEALDELIGVYAARRWSYPTFVSRDVSCHYLEAYSDRQASQLLVKAIMSPANAFRSDGMTQQGKLRDAFIDRLLLSKPDLVQAAFHEVTLGSIQKKYLPKLDKYGHPYFRDLPKLPQRYRDQHFATDLGL